ncbi:MAG: protein-glutamate O-methyltransferase [Rhodospirillales bacterium]|nr:protein-glutamate O-methyltransferase [Rhodospirillales bacterium]MCW8951275.1 protein-glutamate O-methyltransferase [Rhodospirillales bacterium]MCW8970747.1 protein-glutamate O-methyltransferase [Rhodospirillales bacterium]MCW9001340.1 protein-glutamate O-methyltransferase [Rhodospirillales bacterium]
MSPDDFDFIAGLLRQESGLVLTPDKAYLLESRLMPVARKRGLKGLPELILALRTKRDVALVTEVTEAMTTNESFFFRDVTPFDHFRDIVLPHLVQTRGAKKSIRIWCAAASSGQEPYSLAMVLKEASAKLPGWKFEILGTDISKEILEKAKAGLYSQFEVQRGLPIQLMVKYFQKRDDQWQIDPALRAMITFKEFNLLHDMKAMGKFDVVFCRNVLIYFDPPTKAKVLANVASLMPSDGILFLGGAETVLGVSDKFRPLPGHRGVYGLEGGVLPGQSVGASPAPAAASSPAVSAAAPRPAFGATPPKPNPFKKD